MIEPLSSEPTFVQPSSLLHANETWFRQLEIVATPRISLFETVSESQVRGDATVASTLLQPSSIPDTAAAARVPAAEPLMLTTDINLSRSDAPPTLHLLIPESDVPQDDVILIDHLYLLYILKLTSSTVGAYA
jgi:hypothetical protein